MFCSTIFRQLRIFGMNVVLLYHIISLSLNMVMLIHFVAFLLSQKTPLLLT